MARSTSIHKSHRHYQKGMVHPEYCGGGLRPLPRFPTKLVPKKLNREFSRGASKLRLRRCGLNRTPSPSWLMSDRGVEASLDNRGDVTLPVD
jgi:hypothetical protein